MKFKGRVIILLLVSLFITSIVAYAASESVDGGSGSWYGGITRNKVIYSKVWDHKVDGRRYHVTVWVKDDNGDKDSVTGNMLIYQKNKEE